MRLIDYQAAIDRYYAEYKKQDICDGSEDRDWLKRCFDEAPTIDAVPVVHGRWIVTIYTTVSERGRIISNTKFRCSECGYSNGRKQSNYCPNCGAKMALEG